MKRESRNLRDGILFLAPNILGFLAFTAFPLVFSLALAFSNWDLKLHNRFKPQGHIRFIGFDNFTALLSDRDFWKYLGNTLFMMLGMPLAIAASLISAIMLSKDLRGGGRTWMWIVAGAILLASSLMLACAGAHATAMTVLICGVISAIILIGTVGGSTAYRTLFYLPYFTSGVATLLLWKKMYSPQAGPINAMLAAIGITGPDWLGSYHWAKPALMIMGFWGAVGSNTMLLYLAALTNVPLELYEAADIDGASRWTRFWNITWPQLAPTTFFIVIMGVIGGLQAGFDAARIMTGGGPAGATTTLAYMIYVEGFVTGRTGYASAAAWILFLLVLVVTLFYWRFGNRYVNE